jgi:hypothetical protein
MSRRTDIVSSEVHDAAGSEVFAYIMKCVVAAIFACCVVAFHVWLTTEQEAKVQRALCASIEEYTNMTTQMQAGICWVNTNTDDPAMPAHWVPAEWLG